MSKIHLIGNAHLDPVWLWRWQEGFSEVLATFKSALDRMNEFPDFKFTSACAVYYEWIEKIDPEMFEEIKKRVQEGRWNIVGGWFLQPDCNIPDGESFARHALISQNYFKDKFGVTAKCGYNVDSFGHNASLPKILKNSGMDNYVFMRPDPTEQGRDEHIFYWESDDESKVLAYRIPAFYNLDEVKMYGFDTVVEIVEKEKRDCMAFYGVGNHGGGPTISLINTINNLDIGEKLYSTPDEYFNEVDKTNLPVIKDELQHHARGCYSAMTAVKAYNRKCEQNLLAAEKFATLAKELTGFEYPHKKLAKAWKNILFNQFHDILCGCSIKSAYKDAEYLFGETLSITEQIINMAIQKIAWNIDTLGDNTLPYYKTPENWKIWEHEELGTPFVVFNPHSFNTSMPVFINQNVTRVTDYKGCEIPFQLTRGEQTNTGFKGTDDKYYTAFLADVPALGYSVYRFFTEEPQESTFESELKISEKSLENSKIKVIFDDKTGDILEFFDKEENKFIISSPCRAVLIDETDCDTWAHGKDSLGEDAGEFSSPEFKIIEQGAVKATLRVTTKYNGSTLQKDFTITPGSAELKVSVKVDFHEKHRALKFTFPMTNEQVTAKIPFGSIKRNGYTGEEPCGSWFASSSLAVANDSKYAYDTKDNEVRMTVLRGAIFADHYGQRDELCEYMDMGVHTFNYSIFPYINDSSAEKAAQKLNMGFKTINGTFHKGNLPENYCGFETENQNIIVTAIKENKTHGTIIRFYDADGVTQNVNIKLYDKNINADVSHNQVKTLTLSGKTLDFIENEQ